MCNHAPSTTQINLYRRSIMSQNSIYPKRSHLVCTISGCVGEHVAKGLCRKHYMRMARTGSTNESSKLFALPSDLHPGQKLGYWTLLEKTWFTASQPKTVPRRGAWRCRCSCGKESIVLHYNLLKRLSLSCGCLRLERITIHGQSGTTKYKVYRNAVRKARYLQRTPPWSEKKAIREMYRRCPEGYHVDHIIPLLGKLVSGLHVVANLQYLPASENCRKQNAFEPTVV